MNTSELVKKIKRLFERDLGNIKRLSEKISESYWEDHQRLYIASAEILDGQNDHGPFSVYSIDPIKNDFRYYLFDICNYQSYYEDVPHVRKSILYPEKLDYKYQWDVYAASSSVFYNARERLYRIPKFTNITKEDILRCTKHFTRHVLNNCLIFNCKWHEFKENKKEKENG